MEKERHVTIRRNPSVTWKYFAFCYAIRYRSRALSLKTGRMDVKHSLLIGDINQLSLRKSFRAALHSLKATRVFAWAFKFLHVEAFNSNSYANPRFHD